MVWHASLFRQFITVFLNPPPRYWQDLGALPIASNFPIGVRPITGDTGAKKAAIPVQQQFLAFAGRSYPSNRLIAMLALPCFSQQLAAHK
jgi:hypothetical protein